jgi:hypothetical protein
MFDQESFLSMDLMEEVFAKFDWPEPYLFEDDFDGINVAFPLSNFFFTESLDGDITVEFLTEDTGQEAGLHLGHALLVFVPVSDRGNGPITPGLIGNELPFRSEEKARNGIYNACTIMLTHLRSVIEGDYSWVQKYVEARDKKRTSSE